MKLMQKNIVVAIVGFGYIGTCIGATLANKGLHVIGIDINKKIVDEINQSTTSINEPGLKELIRKNVGKRLHATTDFSVIKNADVIIVTVGTPLKENFEPDLSQITTAFIEISKYLKRGQLIILRSTVTPGVTETIVKPLLEKSGLHVGKDVWLAYCPERLAEGEAIQQLQTLPVVVGGINEESTKVASLFWNEVLGVKTVEVSNARTAEMVKLADNLWIDLNIALANELAMLCDKLHIDVLEVIDAANTLPKLKYNVNILMPGPGVGGSCLTKDPWFVQQLGRKKGLKLKTPVTSRSVNDAMPRYVFESIKKELEKVGKSISTSKVAVLGIAFKSNTGDVRFTPAKHIIKLLEESGCELTICDPWVNESDAREVTSKKLVPTIEEAIKKADCVVFLTGHKEFKDFPIEKIARLVNDKCIIFDGRIYFSREEIQKIRKLGMIYKGIGR